jgi:hypothetical protein
MRREAIQAAAMLVRFISDVLDQVATEPPEYEIYFIGGYDARRP